MSDTTTDPSEAAAEAGSARDKGGKAARRLMPLPVSAFLLLLVLVTLVPALTFSLLLLQRNNEAQHEVVLTLAEAMAGSVAETVDRELAGMTTTLRVLSSSDSLSEGDFADFYLRSRAALANSNDYLILLDRDLNQIFNTRVPYGTRLGRTSDPESARRALSGDRPIISDVFFGQTAQRWVFNVILPWFDGEEPVALVLTKNAEDLSTALASQNLRGGWNAAIVDRNGLVAASSYLSSDIGNPFFLDHPAAAREQRIRQRISRGDEVYETVTIPSQLSGWRVVLWAPATTVEAPMRQSMRTLALGGFAMVLLGAAVAWLLAHQVARPVRRLERDARRLGSGEMVEATEYPVAEISTVSKALAQAARERQAAEDEIRFLMREVAHRSKNQLSVVSSIAKQTARHAQDFEAFEDSFQKRIQGLARSTDLLVEGGVAGVELRALLRTQIQPFRPRDESRLKLEGPYLRLSDQAAQTIGLAVHELATNAAKYGAFNGDQGTLTVRWSIAGGMLEIVWREKVPRLAEVPDKRGFGTEVIERMLGGTLDARIERTLHPHGLECRFVIPIEKVNPPRRPGAG